MQVFQLVPEAKEVKLNDFLEGVEDYLAKYLSKPFSSQIVEFCVKLSEALFSSPKTRRFPEVLALAYWMRKSELLRLRNQFKTLRSENTIVVPRGLIFHISPSNVDTIFMYSWLFSFLSGNRNIIRLSQHITPAIKAVIEVFSSILADPSFEKLRGNTYMVTYGHQTEITRAISAKADGRVIWGSDTTVSSLRAVPIPPHCKEITFPDRFSFAVLKPQAFLALAPQQQRQLLERFFSDAYWFDQMACSSPRLIVWCDNKEMAQQASSTFFDLLHKIVHSNHYTVDTGIALNKIAYAYQAILDMAVSDYNFYGNDLCVLTLNSLTDFRRDHCGGGLFFQFFCEDLVKLIDFVERKDQTVAYFGLAQKELEDLALLLNGRGVDRFVPFGQSLNFNRFWDGYDLLHEMTRIVYLEPYHRNYFQS